MSLAILLGSSREPRDWPVAPREIYLAAFAAFAIALVLWIVSRKAKSPRRFSHLLTLFVGAGIALIALIIVMAIADSGSPMD